MASILAHIGLGIVLALFFVLYYINGQDGKWKIFIEILLGLGGNAGAIFVLLKAFEVEDNTVKMLSVAACLFAFIVFVILFVIAFSFMIKDRENEGKPIIRLRDIIIGQTQWIKQFRDSRMKEIEENLNYNELQKRKEEIDLKEKEVDAKRVSLEQELHTKRAFIEDEKRTLKEIGNKKLHMELPVGTEIVISKDFIDVMPSYFKDVVRCIVEMNMHEKEHIQNEDSIDMDKLKSYLYALSTSICTNIFSTNSGDIRIHFRYYNKEKGGYEKLIAIKGNQLFTQNMTFIPYNEENMIVKSYENKRALIKSINCEYDFKSDNNAIWKDYLTYTFYNVKSDNIPYLSFGISLKNEIRYKKIFYFLNYINFFEEYLQEKIETLHMSYDLENILYGGEK